ncbi:hypoxanthine phosphoribosyltransferase [Roseivirga misakiensis]|uniref:Hypoxanthine phosphoribosyltransferase n=1 Tax=Roseivirga misakiensis TaxID=1563681 RepID=A0A1E5T5M3_9BACT|nr:hypoxanthine phosphoribosyltransferase [Roseivirga misakiensis]OEK06607.1 hypoxanthine phosphoribosyltransferase [Roseivirga misakiensis]
MNHITVHNKTFEPFLREDEIQQAVQDMGKRISSDYHGKSPLIIGVLNGAFMFCSDLFKEVSIPCEVTFVRLSSYEGTKSTGEVRTVMNLQEDVSGRDIILVEDIVDTGLTMEKALKYFHTLNPNSIEIATLLVKPDALQCELDIRYRGFDIPEKFVVGYGLDYDGYGRNFKDIYQLKQDQV